jgi:NAD(P)-dependent dehydrogenase (short-subunit alcohol dehydrogenase family)
LLTEWSDTYVILAARDIKRGEEAVTDLIQSIGKDTRDRIELCVLDTSSDESVRSAAQSFETKFGDNSKGSLYGIINNAGVRHIQHVFLEPDSLCNI